MKITVKHLTGKINDLDNVNRHMSVANVKELIHGREGIPPDQQRLIFTGVELKDYGTLADYGIEDGATLHLNLRLRGGACARAEFEDNCAVFHSTPDFGITIKVPSFHVSCQSDSLVYGQDYAGIMLLMYDGKTDWRLNGVHCRAGYIYLKKSDSIASIDAKEGKVHGKTYKSLFGAELDEKVVGTGFSFQKTEFKWKSFTFNTRGDGFHDACKGVSVVEEKCILMALMQWHQSDGRNQNFFIAGSGIMDKDTTELHEQFIEQLKKSPTCGYCKAALSS